MDDHPQLADFADILHLANCNKAITHTLNQELCKVAREADSAPVVRIL